MHERGADADHEVERADQRGRLVVIVNRLGPVLDLDAVANPQCVDLVAGIAGVLQANEMRAGHAQQRQQLLERKRTQLAPRPAHAAGPGEPDLQARAQRHKARAPALKLLRISPQIAFMPRKIRRVAPQQAGQAAHLDAHVDGRGRKPLRQPATGFGAEYRGRGKRAPECRDQPRIALDHAGARLREQLRQHGGEHQFVAQALLPRDEQRAPGQRPAVPARHGRGRRRVIAAQAAQIVALPAALEVARQQPRHAEVKRSERKIRPQRERPVVIGQRLRRRKS